jgi:hypothetical protein
MSLLEVFHPLTLDPVRGFLFSTKVPGFVSGSARECSYVETKLTLVYNFLITDNQKFLSTGDPNC